jgi:hypothetical protein
MFSYNIAKNADKSVFDNTCVLIEGHLENIKKGRLLQDVDGTTIQIYESPNGKIKVYNDYEVDAVYVDSEIDLKEILG